LSIFSFLNLAGLSAHQLSKFLSNDDRAAFEKICRWSNDSSYFLRNHAQTARRSIEKFYASMLWDTAYPEIEWKEDKDPSTMSFQDIQHNWETLQPNLRSYWARHYVEFVWKHKNISKKNKITFLFGALDDSNNSLQAANWAAETLTKEAKIQYKTPFNFAGIREWGIKEGYIKK
jgi:hypothetical protein